MKIRKRERREQAPTSRRHSAAGQPPLDLAAPLFGRKGGRRKNLQLRARMTTGPFPTLPTDETRTGPDCDATTAYDEISFRLSPSLCTGGARTLRSGASLLRKESDSFLL
ncbi:hypothetical protein MRX96_038736 [Rhipicephalus microplus]